MNYSLRVVKVGGSLYDLPDLAQRLRRWLERAGSRRTLLVPGGGPTADAIRTLDRTHRLGEEASHWLALAALSVNARLLSHLLPETPVLARLPEVSEVGDRFILDPLPFFQEDERHPGRFPHRWEVTSDSLAVRVAMRAAAAELILLKSVSWPVVDGWSHAARSGIVDGFFEEALRQAPELRVAIVDLRR